MKVLVLMGGSSTERDVSLTTGEGVAKALVELGHDVIPIDPATGKSLPLKFLEEHRIGEAPEGHGLETGDTERSLSLARSPDLVEADVVFNALHGGIGEDGTVQALLDLAGVPYTGSGMLASALAMDKARTKMLFRAAKIPTPKFRVLKSRDDSWDPTAFGGFPVVVKPVSQGSSVGVHIVQKPEQLDAALDDAFKYAPVMVEQFVPGREVTVAVLAGKPLPVIEIIPEDGFYDYKHKYTKGETRYVVPAEVPETVASEAARLAKLAYNTIGCRGVARVDFRLDPDDALFCLEINTIPGMTETSLVPMAAGEAGMGYGELVEKLVADAVDSSPGGKS